MGNIFNRFTNNSGSVFHSSGLTDDNTRQIGGGAGNASSFRSRLAIDRNRRVIKGYRNASVTYAYRQSTELNRLDSAPKAATSPDQKAPLADARQQLQDGRSLSQASSPGRPSFGAESSGRTRYVFVEPESRSRDPRSF